MHSCVNVHSRLHCSSDGRHLPQATRRSRGHRITCAVLQWCPRLCLTCSTLWALRTTWSCLITLADKSAKDKPPSVVGVQSLHNRIAWQLRDDIKITRVYARVIIMCAFYNPLKNGGEIPRKEKKMVSTSCPNSKKMKKMHFFVIFFEILTSFSSLV